MANLTAIAGQTTRFPVDVSVLGVAADPASLTLHIQDAAGNVTTNTGAVQDGTVGDWYLDVDFASNAALGVWAYYWTSVGTQPNQYGVSEPVQFLMVSPGF